MSGKEERNNRKSNNKIKKKLNTMGFADGYVVDFGCDYKYSVVVGLTNKKWAIIRADQIFSEENIYTYDDLEKCEFDGDKLVLSLKQYEEPIVLEMTTDPYLNYHNDITNIIDGIKHVFSIMGYGMDVPTGYYLRFDSRVNDINCDKINIMQEDLIENGFTNFYCANFGRENRYSVIVGESTDKWALLFANKRLGNDDIYQINDLLDFKIEEDCLTLSVSKQNDLIKLEVLPNVLNKHSYANAEVSSKLEETLNKIFEKQKVIMLKEEYDDVFDTLGIQSDYQTIHPLFFRKYFNIDVPHYAWISGDTFYYFNEWVPDAASMNYDDYRGVTFSYDNFEKRLNKYPISDINYYTYTGEIYSETSISGGGGGGVSIPGAIVGGLIAGAPGAIIGGKKSIDGLQTQNTVNDERKTILSVKNKENKDIVLEFAYDDFFVFKSLIPEKDLAVVNILLAKSKDNSESQKQSNLPIVDQIREFGKLRDEGLLTDEEFENKKKQLLNI